MLGVVAMKKIFLTSVAVLLLSGAVSRADELPKQMLGDWCEAENGGQYFRGTCEKKFKLKGNGYEGYADTEGYGCDFKSIRQLTGSSWFVRSECGGEAGLVPGDDVIAIEGKTLKIINVTVSVCLAVIDPPAEVTKDREFKADSWLVLREAPDTKSKPVVKLGNKEKLEADEIRDDWTHVSNVIRLSEADASPNQKLVQGWVRSKYLVERQCYDDLANEPLPPPDEPPPPLRTDAAEHILRMGLKELKEEYRQTQAKVARGDFMGIGAATLDILKPAIEKCELTGKPTCEVQVPGPPSPKFEIVTDLGGNVDEYQQHWFKVRDLGANVEIIGGCESACTMVLSYVPKARICFAPYAWLAFHSARLTTNNAPSPHANRYMFDRYPPEIRAWLVAKGGWEKLPLTGYWRLEASELFKMGYRRCS